MMMIAGVLVGLVSLALGIWLFVDRNGGEGRGSTGSRRCSRSGSPASCSNLVVQYWMKVGRLEMKGRPRK